MPLLLLNAQPEIQAARWRCRARCLCQTPMLGFAEAICAAQQWTVVQLGTAGTTNLQNGVYE